MLQTIESNWESLIGFIESYEPTGVATLPIEILTETLAAGLKAIGIVIPKAIDESRERYGECLVNMKQMGL